MSDECITKLCSLCGKRITGANWYCPHCKICVCFYCGIKMAEQVELEYPIECPMCRRKLQ